MNASESPSPANAGAGAKDWLALQSSASVFGPFTQEELRGYVASGQIEETAQFFQRQASLGGVGEQLSGWVRRATDAEERLAAAEAEVERLKSDLEAKGIEAEGERQQWQADLAKVRAESLRKDAEIESLRRERGRQEGWKETLAALEVRTVEAERALSEKASQVAAATEEAHRWQEKAEAAEKALRAKCEEFGRRVAAAMDALKALAQEGNPPAETVEVVEAEVVSDKASADASGTVADAEEVEAVTENPPGGQKRLASLEAQARQELARLKAQGGKPPRHWAKGRG